MTISLLNAGDHLSLEFDNDDLETVRDWVRKHHNGWDVRPASHIIPTTLSTVSFGGEVFVYQNEWDDPCLISSTDTGDAILRAIHADLVGA